MKAQMVKIVSSDTPGTLRTDASELNHLLNVGWRVVMCCPMSHPSGSSSALVIVERELEKDALRPLGRERLSPATAAQLA